MEEMRILGEKRVCVVGCGGLGGYILEKLARIGVLSLTAVDGDVFSTSNLNRQILSTEKNIGEYKTDAAARRIREINSEVIIHTHKLFINEENAEEILRGHDVIIDALDNIPTRLLLERYAQKLKIPLIHGAIQGWLAQIAVIMPGDRVLEQLYGTYKSNTPSTPAFTPAFCASVQVSETIKLLCGRETLKRGCLLMFDLCDNSVNTFDMTFQNTLVGLTRYAKRGEPGEKLEEAYLIEGLGFEGNYRSGEKPDLATDKRQLSLLSPEERQWMEAQAEKGLCFTRYKENLLFDSLAGLSSGDRLRLGEAVIEISDVDVRCFEACSLFDRGMNCILPERKLFAQVIKSGKVKIGDRTEKEGA
jgi:molybdopterin/thiamine biosynthesis adenylyltransferase